MEMDILVKLLFREIVSHNLKLWRGLLERNVMMDYEIKMKFNAIGGLMAAMVVIPESEPVGGLFISEI